MNLDLCFINNQHKNISKHTYIEDQYLKYTKIFMTTLSAPTDFGNAWSITSLPKRPQQRAPIKTKQIPLISNMFKVNINFNTKIYAYHVDFHPEVQADNRDLKREILTTAAGVLKAHIGNFANSGQNLYGVSNPIFTDGISEPEDFKRGKGKLGEHIWVKCLVGSQERFLRIRLVKTVKLQDLTNQKDRFPIPLQFLDKLLGTMMRSLNLRQVGKARAFVGSKPQETLNCGIALYAGYFASFNLYAEGLFLKIDTCTKIIRTKTVLERINQIYQSNSGLSKEDRREKVKEELIGTIVMANYGNTKHWKIEGLIFDEDATTLKFADTTMAQYYRQKYQLNIRTPKQPFIKSTFSKRDDRPCILVPEFLFMTGMPEGDQRLRREVSNVTIRPPDEKLKKIKDLLSKLSASNADLCLKSLSQKLGFNIQSQPHVVSSPVLPSPRLIMGSNKYVDQSKSCSFNFRNFAVYSSKKTVELIIAYFSQTDIHTVQKSLSKIANQASINVNIQIKNLGQFRHKASIDTVKEFIFHKSGQSKDSTVIMVVLPNQMKPFYKQIKKASLLTDTPILTQMVLEATLKKKGLESILTKIILQIAAKAGNTLWVSSSNSQPNQKIMIVGVHQTGKVGNKGRVVTAFSSTLNDNFQEYFSKSYVTNKAVMPIIEKMQQVVAESMKAYMKNNNGQYPQEIIILRNGSTDNLEQIIYEHQIKGVIDLMEMKHCKSKLTFISLDSKPSHKFFFDRNGKMQNPPCGTVINQKLVSPYYDFYLYPSLCNMGAAVPVRYKIIHTNSEIEPHHLQSLMYTQCFNYANWTGSIRFPACLQYAKKLSQYVSEQIDDSLTNSKLDSNLYFI